MYTLQPQLPASIFRAYDIRGVVDHELSADAVYTIGVGLGNTAYTQGQTQFIVGRDGRLSSPTLSAALIAGLRAAGCDLIDIGMVPTPLLYFATHILGAGTGVMLTGSHNPPQYNGLKMLLGGETLHGAAITALYQKIAHQDWVIRTLGSYKIYDIREQYLQAILDRIHLKRNIKVVVDCGNGVTGEMAPLLLTRLGCEVIPLFCTIDGTFPHHHPDPMVPANLTALIAAVKKERADLGLAFDGDGDRLGLVTEQGDIIWPDRQLLLYAQDVLRSHPGATIVYDVKCSRLLTVLIQAWGGKPIMSPSGHSIIKAALKSSHALLAGEMSGHIFFNDNWFGFDDALYCAARLLCLLSQQSLPISALFAQFPTTVCTPELPIAVNEAEKFSLVTQFQQHAQFPTATITTMDGLRADFVYGWGLIRASNTTPTLVTRFEADTTENLQLIQAQFKQQLLAIAPKLILPF